MSSFNLYRYKPQKFCRFSCILAENFVPLQREWLRLENNTFVVSFKPSSRRRFLHGRARYCAGPCSMLSTPVLHIVHVRMFPTFPYQRSHFSLPKVPAFPTTAPCFPYYSSLLLSLSTFSFFTLRSQGEKENSSTPLLLRNKPYLCCISDTQ